MSTSHFYTDLIYAYSIGLERKLTLIWFFSLRFALVIYLLHDRSTTSDILSNDSLQARIYFLNNVMIVENFHNINDLNRNTRIDLLKDNNN